MNWDNIVTGNCSKCDSQWNWLAPYETSIVINKNGTWTCYDCIVEHVTYNY